ncbi:hypothetical protein GLW20_01600 [Virgibacillus halodenitrificans]|nr:hypothetical protein [Virgibacillus halodenitrificans]
MRYADRITLHQTTGRQYNPETGSTETMVDAGVTLPCDYTHAGVEKAAAVFGSYETELGTARLQRPFKGVADKAVVNGQKYKILRHVPHRSESVFYLEGVSEWT